MGTTANLAIPYPDGPTNFTPLQQKFQDLAEAVDLSVTAAIAGTPRKANSNAERDAIYPAPNQGDLTWRPDKGWVEEYFAAYNGTTNPLGATPAGWYPVYGMTPQAQFYRLSPAPIAANATVKVLAGATTRRISPDITLNGAGDLVFATLGIYEAKIMFEWSTANATGQRNMSFTGTVTNLGSTSFTRPGSSIAQDGQYGHFHFGVTAAGQTFSPNTSHNGSVALTLRNTVDISYIGPNQ